MRDIWAATQADRVLQQVDAEDVEHLAGMLGAVMQRLRPDEDPAALATLACLVMQLIAAAVRHAISRPGEEGDRVLDMCARAVPGDLFALIWNTRHGCSA
jgi:hypothetical protein